MKATDLKDIISGILVLSFLAMSVGQYGNIQKWARKEFARSLTPNGWHNAPFFSRHRGKTIAIDH